MPGSSRGSRATRLVLGILVGSIAIVWLERVSERALDRGNESDVVRQWVVTQYVRNGDDPYEIAKEVLRSRLGEASRRTPIGNIPNALPDPISKRVLEPIGAPEATYPPGAVGLLTITLGWLGSTRPVLWAWLVVNIVSAAVVVRFLGKTVDGGASRIPVSGTMAALVVMMIFLPSFHAIGNGQFSFPVMACLLFGLQTNVKEEVAGIAMGLALIKPSISLPFLFLDMLKGRWKRLAIAVGI